MHRAFEGGMQGPIHFAWNRLLSLSSRATHLVLQTLWWVMHESILNHTLKLPCALRNVCRALKIKTPGLCMPTLLVLWSGVDSEYFTSLPSGSGAMRPQSARLRSIKKSEGELAVECGVNYRVRNAACALLLMSIWQMQRSFVLKGTMNNIWLLEGTR